jgi:peptidoglycan hydrolase CwlO-like protein
MLHSFLVLDGQLTRAISAALNEFRAEVSEANAKLERLEEKLRDLEMEEAETTASIEASQQKLHILENSTQTEVLRLKGTSLGEVLRAIFHLWLYL